MDSMEQDDWDFVTQRLNSVAAGTKADSDGTSIRTEEATVVIEDILKEEG
jgi:hypothetical protein